MNEADRIIAEAFEALPLYQRTAKHIGDVGYRGDVSILRAPYNEVVSTAVELRRRKICDTRADAVETAFDRYLDNKTEGAWMRTGEVHLDKSTGYARAFCSSPEKEPV